MELWGGFECTLNRVRGMYRDQLAPGDRRAREQCLELLPQLGIKAFRYRIAWDDLATPQALIDADMAMLAKSNVRPIVGLLHHGSGPAHTDLLNENFAAGLADHARRTAERFGQATMWTPINEPLTTARFSALYGHWHPHARSEREFWLALLNQVDATRLAMREIRRINPAAQLVQTEDLGRTFGTAAVADQVAFDNQRRWILWDLLVGAVVAGHPLHSHISRLGFAERLRMIADDPCPPDLIGVDHYLTTDRFLDHRLQRYPTSTRGGNGRIGYADVEAVRVLSAPRNSIGEALREAWERYRIPVALTECQLGCTREEQMRWLREAWQSAEALVAQGCDIRAVTAWSMLGARDWSSLATEDRGHFECGAVDPRSGEARLTGVAHVMTALTSAKPVAPAARGPGWWRRDDRLAYPAAGFAAPVRRGPPAEPVHPLLIAGATGTLGRALLDAARQRGLPAVITTRGMMNLHDRASVEAAIDRYRPWAVINAAGWVRVDEAEANADACMRVNRDGAIMLADVCDRGGIANLHFSSDLVFDGASSIAYREDERTAPINIYGASKAAADTHLQAVASALIIRTAAFFSPFDRYNFAVGVIDALLRGDRVGAAGRHLVTPTYVPHLANAALDLLIDGARGLWHVSNGEELSWLDFGRRIADACNLDPDLLHDASPRALGWTAKRPLRCGLASRHGQLLPPLQTAIDDFARHISSPTTGRGKTLRQSEAMAVAG